MKRWSFALALTFVLSAVVAAGPAISQPPAERTTLTFFDPRATDFEKGLNLGGKGFAGDMAVVKDTMFDPETCEKSATLLLRFQAVKAIGENDGFFITDGGLILPDGKLGISLFGRFSEFASEGGSPGAVTGGTGANRDVTGEFTVSERHRTCDKRGSLITASLLLE